MYIASILKGLIGAVAFVAVTGFVYTQKLGDHQQAVDPTVSDSLMTPTPPVEIHAIVAVEDLIRRVRLESPKEKVVKVNAFLNQIPYVKDQDMWGEEDRWSMPYEFLATGAGDSEDFAIAKFYALWAAGIPVEKMTLAISLHPLIDEEHVVLLVNLPGAEHPLVLDSLSYDLHYLDDHPELLVVRTLQSDLLLPRLEKNREQMLDVVINWQLSHGNDVIAKLSK
jgi:predicted transglutaminase-like cysteine proteinase